MSLAARTAVLCIATAAFLALGVPATAEGDDAVRAANREHVLSLLGGADLSQPVTLYTSDSPAPQEATLGQAVERLLDLYGNQDVAALTGVSVQPQVVEQAVPMAGDFYVSEVAAPIVDALGRKTPRPCPTPVADETAAALLMEPDQAASEVVERHPETYHRSTVTDVFGTLRSDLSLWKRPGIPSQAVQFAPLPTESGGLQYQDVLVSHLNPGERLTMTGHLRTWCTQSLTQTWLEAFVNEGRLLTGDVAVTAIP